MDEKKLNKALKVVVTLLVCSIVFCTFSIVFTVSRSKDKSEANNQSSSLSKNVTDDAVDVTAYDNGENGEGATSDAVGVEEEPIQEETQEQGVPAPKKVIVVDAGHGKSSSSMTQEEKVAEGFVYNEQKGSWGEWRHYKNDTFGVDCQGSGCTGRVPSNGSCWYPMGNGDRSTEPEVTLNNALAAQKYLEEMGYEVRMTRVSNDQNPSMNKRVSYCFPDNDTSQIPDADLYVCIHSNAGGGGSARGTAYISLDGEYRQMFIPADYVDRSNTAADIINTKVAAASGITQRSPIGNEEWLILFNKSPIPIAYLEIGFYDNSSDLAILQSSSDAIGQAIAEGVDEYFATYSG